MNYKRKEGDIIMGETWKEISIKEKMQIVNGTACVFGAITLYFIAFLVMFVGSFPLVSAGAMLLGTGLAFFGLGSFIKNQMMEFETRITNKMIGLEKGN